MGEPRLAKQHSEKSSGDTFPEKTSHTAASQPFLTPYSRLIAVLLKRRLASVDYKERIRKAVADDHYFLAFQLLRVHIMGNPRKKNQSRWPQSLGSQIALPLAIILTMTVGIFAWYMASKGIGYQRSVLEKSITETAQSFKSMPLGFNGTPNKAVETFLLASTKPPIQHISITQMDGTTVISVIKPDNGKAYLYDDPQKLDAPEEIKPSKRKDGETLTYWLPVRSVDNTLYWLATKVSLSDLNRFQSSLISSAVVLSLAVIVAVMLVFVFATKKPFQNIKYAAMFAQNIANNAEAKLPLDNSAEELDELAAALNRISEDWHHQLHQHEETNTHLRMHKVAIDLHAAVSILNADGSIEYMNNLFCLASGYTDKELHGKNFSVLHSDHHDKQFYQHMWRCLTQGQVWQGELCQLNKRGKTYWVQCTIAPVRDHLGKHSQYIVIQTHSSRAHDRVSGVAASK